MLLCREFAPFAPSYKKIKDDIVMKTILLYLIKRGKSHNNALIEINWCAAS